MSVNITIGLQVAGSIPIEWFGCGNVPIGVEIPRDGATLPLASDPGRSTRKWHDHETTNASLAAPVGAPKNLELRKEGLGDVRDSFEKFRLTCGIEVLQGMMEEDVAVVLAGECHECAPDKSGYRWSSTVSRFDFHGGKVLLDQPRVHDKNAGKEIPMTTWEHFSNGEMLREWAAP